MTVKKSLQHLVKKRRKISCEDVARLRLKLGLTYEDIANRLNTDKSTVHRAFKRFSKIVPSALEADIYAKNRPNILNAVEYRIVRELANEDKIKAASLNNCAYTLQQLHSARRLEEGKSTNNQELHISIQHKEIAQKVIDSILAQELSTA